LNLRAIRPWLSVTAPGRLLRHETGIPTSVCAAALAHAVLSATSPWTVQLGLRSGGIAGANGISRLVRDIRLWAVKGDGIKRVFEREVPIIKNCAVLAQRCSPAWQRPNSAKNGLEHIRAVAVDGDGGFMFNIQELETIHRLQLPINSSY